LCVIFIVGTSIIEETIKEVKPAGNFTNFKEYATEFVKRRPIKEQGKRALKVFIDLFENYKRGLSLQDISPAVIDGFKVYLSKKN